MAQRHSSLPSQRYQSLWPWPGLQPQNNRWQYCWRNGANYCGDNDALNSIHQSGQFFRYETIALEVEACSGASKQLQRWTSAGRRPFWVRESSGDQGNWLKRENVLKLFLRSDSMKAFFILLSAFFVLFLAQANTHAGQVTETIQTKYDF